MTVKRYRVYGTIRLTTGQQVKFATIVEAINPTEAKAAGTAEAYHSYGAANIKNLSLTVSSL